MKDDRVVAMSVLVVLWLFIFPRTSAIAQSLKEQNGALFEQLQRVHGLSDGQMGAIRAIFSRSGYIGQGNPAIARHPVTPQG